MKVSYRGASYEAQNPAVDTTSTEQTGLFLGNRFKIQHHNISYRHSGSVQLKYRGTDYTA